jgi:hypothetical protein
VLQAWAFCVHAFGFPDIERTCLSIRCKGSAHRQYLQKRRLRRKLPIPMVLLGLLEMAACQLQVDELRAQAGFICFLTHSRLRNHEGNLVITWDANASTKRLFLEGNLAGNKTGKSKEKKASFLPLVTPLRGVATDEWFPSFVLARERLGLDSLPSEWDGASCAEVPLVLPSPRDPLKAISSNKVSGACEPFLWPVGTERRLSLPHFELVQNHVADRLRQSWRRPAVAPTPRIPCPARRDSCFELLLGHSGWPHSDYGRLPTRGGGR